MSLASLEKRLCNAADQFRANSGIKSQENSDPILDPVFGSGGMFVQSPRFGSKLLRCRLPHGDRLVVETRGDRLCPYWFCP